MRVEDDFGGAKIALLFGSMVVAYVRDRKPTIPHPGRWDLPGGRREGTESPIDCVVRETEEEFGITLDPALMHWQRFYADWEGRTPGWHFFVARIGQADIDAIRFGDEGQRWALMPFSEFLSDDDRIPVLHQCLCDYVEGAGWP